ncbi:hypothetical protein GGI00_006811 [Coemansia sp. RSA 2681]|nr:hypothetical protein GGI00_006811 [Coemansia sp. RSA 2681]
MLRVGDKGSSDVAIARLVSTPARRGAELLINLYCQSEKTATAKLVLLYWGAFIDIDRAFEYAQDRWFTIQLAAAAVNVAEYLCQHEAVSDSLLFDHDGHG